MKNIESQTNNFKYEKTPYVGMPLGGMRDHDYYKRPKPGYKMPEYMKPECKEPVCRKPECKEPAYTMPECVESVCSSVDVCPLAMAYVPWQRWCNTYEPAEAHHRGTIFPELDLPWHEGGAY